MKKITSPQNPLVKHLVKINEDKNHREKERLAVVSGLKTIVELSKFIHPSKVLISKELDISFPQAETFIVTSEIIKKITKLPSNEGIVAAFALPNPSTLEGKKRILACDLVADPGNLGTLLRSALSFGFDGVFLLHHSCDLFNDKVIRASKGASFLLPYRFGTFEELKKLALENGLKPLIADVNGKKIEECPFYDKIVLLLGNESFGPRKEAKTWGLPVTIEISDKMESLNVAVAGSILMYALQRR